MSDYSSFAKPVDDYASFAKPVDDYSSFAKPAEETSLLEDIKIPLAQAGTAIDTGFTLAGAGLGTLFGDKPDDEVFRAMDERRKAMEQWANPRGAEQSFAAKLGGTVATLPAQMAAVVGQGPERMRQMIDMGESVESAQKAGLVDTALNVGSIALPAAIGTKLATKVATGAGANVATGAASDVYTQSVAEQEATKAAYDPTNVEARSIEAIIGAGFGSVARGKPSKGGTKAADVITNLDNLDKAKEQAKQTQGEGTLYVGPDGRTSDSLPTKIQEDQGQLDLARTELQNNLQREATAREELPQGELFPKDPVTGEPTQIQENLDLVTRPNEPPPPDDTGGGTPARSLSEEARLNAQALEIQARAAEKAGDTEKAAELRRQADLELEKTKEFVEPKAAPDPDKLLSDTGSIFAPDETGAMNRLVDIQKLPSYDKETGEFNPIEYLTSIRDTHVKGKHRAYRAVYDLILKALSKMPEGRIPRFALDIDPLTQQVRPLTYDRTGNQGKDAAGQYDPNTDVVWIGRRGENEGTIVHEVIHALTSRVLHLYKPSDVRVRDLYKIYNSVINDPAFKTEYGTLDIHEFIAETFSSPRFQAKLAQHTLKPGIATKARNTLHAIVQEIVSVLGYTKQSPENRIFTNALEEIVFNTERLVNLYAENKKSFDEMWLSAVPSSVNVESIPTKTSRAIDTITGGAASAARAGAVASKASILSDSDTTRSDTLKSLTGEEWIPRDPEITPELLDKISKEADGSNVWALTPGALARSELAKSTLVKTIYRLMDNAYKRGDLFATRVVAPVEKTFSKILNNDQFAKISHDLIMRELGNGKEYTTDELRAAGVPEKVVMAHLEFRAMMQQALEVQNKVLRDKGLPPVKPIDAYMSARWSGPWRANIRDSEGKIIWQIAEQSRGAAKAAMEYIKAKEPNLVFEDVKFKQGRERGDRVETGYLDMLKLLDKDDPRIQTLQSIYEDYILGKTENVTAQEKHFLRKTGVKGFAGSRPWSKTDAKDMLVQQFQYAKNAARWAETQLPMEKVNTLLNDPNLQESQKNNIAFSKEYTKNQLGFGTKSVFEAIDNSLAKAFGTSPQKLQEYMGAAKTVFYLKTLGLSLPFTITQFLQPAITTPGWHSKLSGEGFKHNPVLTTLNSIAKGGAGASWHYARVMGNEGQMKLAEKMLNDVELDAVKYMEANSVVEINPLSDIKRNLRPTSVKAVAAPFEFTIRHSELIARSMAFMGYVSHLQQSGKFDTSTKEGRMKLFQQAEDMAKISMTDYRPQERALLFERGGLTGDAAATLHSYQINNLAQLTKFSKMALEGNPKPLVMMVGMQAMAAGLTGLWFVEDLDDLWENLKKLLPADEYLKVKDLSIKNYILDNLGEVGAYGLASSLTGTNIHTRMNASDQIPVWPFEPQLNMESLTDLAPFVESTAAIGGAALTGLNPNATEQEKMAALYKAAPAGAQGPMENLPAFNQGPTSLNTKDLTLGEYRRTPEEKNLRNLGFRSPEEQKFKDKKWTLSKVEQQLQQRLSTAGKKATQFVISGDMPKANAEIQKYQDLGGDVETLVQGLSKAQLNRLTVELERRALTAESGSLPAVMKLKRYVDIYGDQTNR